jgi:hypothetical protein
MLLVPIAAKLATMLNAFSVGLVQQGAWHASMKTIPCLQPGSCM